MPLRSVVCWTGEKKGIGNRRSHPGVQLVRRILEQFPQKAKAEISNPVGRKTNMKVSETKRDTNESESEGGRQVGTVYSL